jgi:hypothetical protein
MEVSEKELYKYKIEADLGNIESQCELANCYSNTDQYKNYDEAFKYYKLSSNFGYIESIIELANCYRIGEGCEKNLEEAFKLLNINLNNNYLIENCRYNIYDIYCNLVSYYYNGYGCEKNVYKAIEYCILSVKAGNEFAKEKLFNIARVYKFGEYQGKIVEKNFELSFKLYKLLADENDPSGLCQIGNCYSDGIGCEKNLEEAYKYYTLSVINNGSDAYFYLALCYNDGIGCERNLKEAFKYYKLLSDDGNEYCMNKIGEFYFEGTGCEKNVEEAFKYFKLLSDNGTPIACYNLYKCYFDGIGCEENKEIARIYLDLYLILTEVNDEDNEVDDKDICSICLSDEGRFCKLKNCNHIFHFNCIKELLINEIKHCPNCRTNFK